MGVPALTRAELIEQVYVGWGAGDLDLATEPLAPGIVWTAIESAPDAGTYVGIDGARGYMTDWLEDFEIQRSEVLEAVERGDRVFRLSRVAGVGRASGVPTDITYSQLYSFDAHGKIERIEEFATREEGWAEFERRTAG
jgi:ketosteroid isomerase-like protein